MGNAQDPASPQPLWDANENGQVQSQGRPHVCGSKPRGDSTTEAFHLVARCQLCRQAHPTVQSPWTHIKVRRCWAGPPLRASAQLLLEGEHLSTALNAWTWVEWKHEAS